MTRIAASLWNGNHEHIERILAFDHMIRSVGLFISTDIWVSMQPGTAMRFVLSGVR
jgi:hypothetical protein